MPSFRSVQQVGPPSWRFITWLGAFGFTSEKPVELITSLEEAQFYLVRDKRTAKRTLQQNGYTKDTKLSAEGAKSARAKASSSSSWRAGSWVNGNNKAMRASAAYPAEFAQMLARVAADYIKRK